MARMINAEVLAKAFAEFLAKSYFGLLRTPTWDDAMDVFCEAPKVDAVEVVRCKNCKYVDTKKCPMCFMGLGYTDDDFCSYGERREDERTD